MSGRGFTLVEALVALLVLSAGVIGMAGLQVRALAAARAAQLQGHAVDLAADMADRIRANRSGWRAHAGAGEGARAAADDVPSTACAGTEELPAAPFTPLESAAREACLWQRRVAQLLPSGEAEIELDESGPLPVFTLRLRWDEPGAGRVSQQLRVIVDHD